MFKNLVALAACCLGIVLPGWSAGYTFVEGYNVLDEANAPGLAPATFAATSGQERDIAYDPSRGIVYMARGLTTTGDGRNAVGIAAIVLTNYNGSNYRDTGLLVPSGGSLSFCQSLAYDPASDTLWVLGAPLGANPIIYSAPGGTLGGAPEGGNPAANSLTLTKAFQVDTNLLETGVYTTNSSGVPIRGGSPRGFAVRTAPGTNGTDVTTVYLGLGNHVEAWSNDQPLTNTNSPWRRAWATLRAPAQNSAATRLSGTSASINAVAVDDEGNVYFNVAFTSPARIWCVKPRLIVGVADPMSLDFDDEALGGTHEGNVIPVLITSSPNVANMTSPQGITFCRFGAQKSLFVSFIPTQRSVALLDIDDEISFVNGFPYLRALAIDAFGAGQPAGNQDSILRSMSLKSASTQPAGTPSNGLLYHEVNSVTNPTHLYFEAFVTDSTKGQTIPTAAVGKVELPVSTNAPTIATQPQPQTLLEGGTISLGVGVNGGRPFSYQWQFNGTNIPSAVAGTLTITNAQLTNSGSYSVVVTNPFGSATSTNATVTVRPMVKSDAMQVAWKLEPGARAYLTTGDAQRGMAYNPDGSDHLFVVSRSPTLGIHVLDAASGADLYDLSTTGIAGGTYALNQIGACADGNVYAANLALNGQSFRIYHWSFEAAGQPPEETLAFDGNPSDPATNRWGDTFDVRGVSGDIQMLAGSRNGNVVAVFTTTDGGYTFVSHVITVADAPNGAFGLGLAFGAGDTFWGKGDGSNALLHVAFDLGTGTGTILHRYDNAAYPATAMALGVEPTRNVLASISVENPDNLRFYNIADLANAPVLLDQEAFATDNPNINATGAVDFGNNRVYALDSNNGLMALTLGDTSGPGRLTVTRNATDVTITWAGNFTLQSASMLPGNFVDVTNGVTSYTEPVATAAQKFFRLRN